MEVRGIPKKEAVERALPLMEKYGLKGFENHYPKELSGGMRQRTALLRTLLYDRDIILLDEPFGALDAQTRLMMQNWLLQIWEDFRKTVLFVTHDIDEAIYLSDDIYVFTARPGRIKAKVTVPMGRPRTHQDMTTPQFAELKHHLLDLLSEEVQIASDQERII
jgi:ABC-type nitrate/sulfonate/bicarbonate transport system ATPase subunit